MEPTQELIDSIYRDKILRARRTSPEEKLLAGPRLFARACRLMADGIRNEFPDDDEATMTVIDALEMLAIPYMVVGSLSCTVYGVPRLSHDADFVVELRSVPLTHLTAQLGSAFRLDPQMTFETTTMSQRHVLEVVGISFAIELFHLSDDPHDQERFRRRRRIKTMGRDVSMPTVE